MSLRPRRSVLYMPGSNSRALEKAKGLPADTLVLDLEDAVAPDQKMAARAQVVEAVKAGGYGYREMVIRVNGLETQWAKDDILAVATAPVAAVCVPKVETPDQVLRVVELLNQGGAPESVTVWAMIETPKGVVNVQAIAAAHPRLSLLMMGTSDLAKEMRLPHTPDRIGFISALSQCVLAARLNGLDALDGVHLDLKDQDSLRLVCEQGRNLGFDGKTLIHPNQIEVTNEVFGPKADEIERAGRIIDAFTQAESEGKGVVVVDGKLVENLHVEEAKRTLAIAEAIEVMQA
ncbi:CoA ester lyase [Aestuariicella sp. G3-2]|uniref:HpcH/HpaI aldolase/citrate lyase family protein n=1 Tax=Pseudomaricurvus albidus TaxID=2842452 RepID=UPI001C0B8EB6|nr:CoA ester lyase [Aestuariicella albida]MBU3070027.1 CoA ester lyase [Aestuariicella albida]